MEALRRSRLSVLGFALLVAGGCIPRSRSWSDPCSDLDPVFTRASFVSVAEPRPTERVTSPFEVKGCSHTFEANVVWVLYSREGRVLARGHTSGGTLGQLRPFSFEVAYTLPADELASLEVIEPDESDGEGHPSFRVRFPLVLTASP